ncbi:uncharacterized protein L969DRAFT_92079 [Mixia osmundae IAM 14324]|uniref:A1 cistron-splicing factor AAR2 n=1 Tax=Mixia osmundae (strain CBS 9802 / IAM 14324 / JCM 22182 / KY 12970) TaxID=764103 RepID=G7DX81_MIXOS|nr:uncharacterized protein L969DRAFT_92079 [Mixia osmundae IAM 14324]KEI42646.1 hypothetical protein L969DRAFT_92079 [Mixia osmundae IAM 14324]GAA95191.1 hypothetical protein E5Q_01846 [Mixia osmundae IAM 14324]
MSGIDAAQARQLFDRGGFFLLSGLKQGSEFGVDGSLWTVRKFEGVKFLPAGLHLFIFSSSPALLKPKTDSDDEDQPSDAGALPGGGVEVRHGLLRFFEAGEAVSRAYDISSDALSGSMSAQLPEPDRPKKRARKLQILPTEIIARDQLRSVDEHLAPYPFKARHEAWTKMTSYIDKRCLARIVGMDERGDALVDAVMASSQDESEAQHPSLASAERRTTWGKQRDAAPTAVSQHARDEQSDAVLRFVKLDLKRSWRQGAVGAELTQDSRDKSGLLVRTVLQLGDPGQLLGELQLAFVLFTLVHNFSALDSWKSIVSLLCQSYSILGPAREDFDKRPVVPKYVALRMYQTFLSTVLPAQLASLRTEFFDEDLPGLDAFLHDELVRLRDTLRSLESAWSAPALPTNETGAWSDVCAGWQSLSVQTYERFGWELGSSSKPLPIPATSLRTPSKTQLHYNLLQDPDDDGYIEEGEDAPQLVETDG